MTAQEIEPKKIAFLVATFPALTETFIVREYCHLAASHRLHVKPFAIKRPVGLVPSDDHKTLTREAFYIRPDHCMGIAGINLLYVFGRPFRYCRAVASLVTALKLCPLKTCHKPFFHMFAGVYLAHYLKRQGYDAIHAHFEAAGNIAMFANIISGIPYTLTLHASADLYHGHKPLLKEKCRRARLIITNNRYNISYINQLTDYEYSEKLNLIYNGIDIELFRHFEAHPAKHDPVRLLSIGSFTGVKGYPTILEALRVIRSQQIDFVYRIVGGGNTEERRVVQSLIAEYGLKDCIEVLGEQPFSETCRHLRWCDIVVMNCETGDAGKRDGLPNVIIEAMLAKRLVVTTYVSDIPNVIEHNVTGYIIPERNAERLAGVLSHIYLNFEDAPAVVEKAHKFAVAHFDARVNYDRLAHLLVLPPSDNSGAQTNVASNYSA